MHRRCMADPFQWITFWFIYKKANVEKMNLNNIILNQMAFVSNSKDLAGGNTFPNRMWICGSSTLPPVSFDSVYNTAIHD